jgi:hypothetical protein
MVIRCTFFSSVILAWAIFSACSFEPENEDGNGIFTSEIHKTTELPQKVESIDADTNIIPSEPDHNYLNSINWEVRQPLDMSRSRITTTANSTADRIQFNYTCNGMEKATTVIPEDGFVVDVIDWECEDEMTTQMIAVGKDTTIEYTYTIDIEFLNSLGAN